ncbi:MAG: N-acetylmuramoyl-L-alanine amidase [Allosphingosinicella sp.]|uniref:N-acetylmuramoyl-L-alanine amidase family protein n=1 Tax=Allosphingosinicella sp. TaxID=2823234 RepID=UPI00393E97AF
MTWLVAFLLSLFGLGEPGDADAGAAGAGVTLPIQSSGAEGPLPALTEARGDDPPVVVIDPGHGGRDPGAPAAMAGLHEKQVTLALARAIRDELAASGRVRVALTREDDRFIPLEGRYEIARRLGADLFISLHADAAPSNDAARGATIYTLSEVASDREAALLAQQQNASDAIGGVTMSRDPNVNLILVDLAQRESMEASARFAQILHREAASTIRFQPDWHRFAAFIVLKAPDIPSVLFESGYVTNAEDVAYLTSPEGREQIATGLRRAIEAHFARRFLARQAR